MADKLKCSKAIASVTEDGATGISQAGRIIYDPNTGSVRLYFYARSSSNISTSDVLGYVPVSYRPSGNWQLYGVIGVGGTTIAAYSGVVHTDGSITQSLSGTARDIFLCGEWII